MMVMMMPVLQKCHQDDDDDHFEDYIGRAILWTKWATTVATCVLFNLQCVIIILIIGEDANDEDANDEDANDEDEHDEDDHHHLSGVADWLSLAY